MNVASIQDRTLLKELIDKVSVLGDQKDFNSQVQLFTEHAISLVVGPRSLSVLQPRYAARCKTDGIVMFFSIALRF